MHEFSLCKGLVSELSRQPPERGGYPLKSIEVTIGPLAGVEETLLKHAFPWATENTPFAGLTLKIKHCAIVVRCQHCTRESYRQVQNLECGFCGSQRTVVIQGDECALTGLSYGEVSHV